MNIGLVKEILIIKLKNNENEKDIVANCFNIANEFQKLAILHGYILPDYCDLCKSELKIVNLSTGKNNQFRCKCTKCGKQSTGETEKDSIIKFWSNND